MGTLIKVLAAARSGSTLLDVMLGNAPDSFSCGEVSSWFRPWRSHHFEIDCTCEQPDCPVWSQFKGVPPSKFHATAIEKLGLNYIVDSSKDIVWAVDTEAWARENGLQVYNLLLWKDPIPLAYSYWKRENGIEHWRRPFVRYHRKIHQMGFPFIAINFKDLANNPAETLEAICNVVGMPYFEGKERFWEKEHHILFGSGGIRRQLQSGKSTIQHTDDESYPPEFEKHIEGLQKQIKSDREVQFVLDLFKKNDLKSIAPGSRTGAPHPMRKPYPAWYYAKQAVATYRRYFPIDFDPKKHKAAETVPLESKSR